MADFKIFNAESDEIELPKESLLDSSYKKLDIADSINAEVVSSKIVRKLQEEMKLPNIVIDIRGISNLQVSEYAAHGLSALERKEGDTHVYLSTDSAIEKIMMTDYNLKEILAKAMQDLMHEEVKVYENVQAGCKLIRIGAKGVKGLRLNL